MQSNIIKALATQFPKQEQLQRSAFLEQQAAASSSSSQKDGDQQEPAYMSISGVGPEACLRVLALVPMAYARVQVSDRSGSSLDAVPSEPGPKSL